MFTPFDTEDLDLDAAIASAYTDLRNHQADSDEYSKAVDQLTKLYALKNQTASLALQIESDSAAQQLEYDKNTWQEEQADLPFYARISPDALISVAGNVLIALVVIKYEQTGVISSKVMSFMKKI